MFLTGFSMNVDKIALDMDCIYINELKRLARVYNFAILGTLPIREKDYFYNRAIFFWPDGNTDIYDKRHLFRMGKEADVYTGGDSRKIIHYRGFNIMPLICYDLRFPVWSRNRNEYDVLIYMANWPKSRRYVWDLLLKARAIENYCYVCVCVCVCVLAYSVLKGIGRSTFLSFDYHMFDFEPDNNNFFFHW